MINNYQSSQGSQGEPARNVDVNFLWSKLANLGKSNQLRNMATVYVSIDGGPAFPVKAVRAAHDGSHAILAAYPEHTDQPSGEQSISQLRWVRQRSTIHGTRGGETPARHPKPSADGAFALETK